MKKVKIRLWFGFLLISLLMTLLCYLFSPWKEKIGFAFSDTAPVTVILDAGHGGEDGGTCDKNGNLEKDLNLKIAFALKEILEEQGVSVILTRSEDTLLYDRTADYKGRKKKLDALKRLEIAESVENPLFVSIHMNSYPDAKYHGLQVWYSQNHKDSAALATEIQRTVKTTLQPENDRAVKPSTSSVYVMSHLQCPGVLVECGFLSNPTEAAELQTESYRNELATAISAGILSWIAQRD